MGDRANYVILEGRKRALYYAHYGASSLETDLFWGPPWALDFVRAQERTSWRDGWLDTVYGEGGAVVDLNAGRLTFFGTRGSRRVIEALYAASWGARGFDVVWAPRGMLDIALAAGVEPAKVCAQESRAMRLGFDDAAFEKPQSTRTVISVRADGGGGGGGAVADYASDADIARILFGGPAILARFHEGMSLASAPRSDYLDGIALIDVAHQKLTLKMYLAAEPQNVAAVAAAWPGWSLDVASDGLDQFCARGGHTPAAFAHLVVPYDWDATLDAMRDALLAAPPDHVEFFAAVSQQMQAFTNAAVAGAAKPSDVVVYTDPRVLVPPKPPVRPPQERAARIVRYAVERVRAARGRPPSTTIFARAL